MTLPYKNIIIPAENRLTNQKGSNHYDRLPLERH